MGIHLPSTLYASHLPGYRGIVTPITDNGFFPHERNWKWAPTRIVTHTPDSMGTIVS